MVTRAAVSQAIGSANKLTNVRWRVPDGSDGCVSGCVHRTVSEGWEDQSTRRTRHAKCYWERAPRRHIFRSCQASVEERGARTSRSHAKGAENSGGGGTIGWWEVKRLEPATLYQILAHSQVVRLCTGCQRLGHRAKTLSACSPSSTKRRALRKLAKCCDGLSALCDGRGWSWSLWQKLKTS